MNNEKEVKLIVDSILNDYDNNRAIDKLQLSEMPEKATILSLLDKIIAIVYFGYYRDKEYKVYDAKTNLALIIEDTMYRLNKQISMVLPYDKANENIDLTLKAEEITSLFFKRIPAIRALLDTDLEAILMGDPAASNKDEIIFAYPGFYAITVYRIAHELFNLKVPMIPRIMSEHAHSLTGIDIHPGATIADHFFIDHGTGIVIGETTIIGKYVKLYQGVTLGAISTRGGQNLKGKKRHPSIEDNVTIYAGASVLGDTLIGSNSVIGGNVFITSDIPSGTTVSVKGQELHFKYRKETEEFKNDEAWSYEI